MSWKVALLYAVEYTVFVIQRNLNAFQIMEIQSILPLVQNNNNFWNKNKLDLPRNLSAVWALYEQTYIDRITVSCRFEICW